MSKKHIPRNLWKKMIFRGSRSFSLVKSISTKKSKSFVRQKKSWKNLN